ncbi:hypothetical protein [Winogradskyella jejuensis]|uniref:Uncharacterized protein n=1 Tax=Winogradskyella jejuensis TaxID=1089305 RepID=A0A1M5LD78_9FLAO|nr:hypothetical protein [Winogradskyella jejuensis]SHG63011.1 hypothetical protein SAMN05444148_0589 [Winogradskyella jejuensis]
MKYLFYLYIILLIPNLSIGQADIYLDVDKNIINKDTFHIKWFNHANMLSRWDFIGKDKKHYATLRQNLYQKGISDYNQIITELEKITSTKVPDSVIILLRYKFKDDLCENFIDNYWTRGEIKNKKKWLEPRLKKFEEANIFYLWLFENGIKLKTKSKEANEFFLLDKNNFFRDKIFTSQTLCSSAAVITKKGEILVMNGEGTYMALYNHVINEEIPLFFKN